jgi:hypothetical protein
MLKYFIAHIQESRKEKPILVRLREGAAVKIPVYLEDVYGRKVQLHLTNQGLYYIDRINNITKTMIADNNLRLIGSVSTKQYLKLNPSYTSYIFSTSLLGNTVLRWWGNHDGDMYNVVKSKYCDIDEKVKYGDIERL